MRASIVVLALLVPAFAGCVTDQGLSPRSAVAEGEPLLVMDLPVHVITVGFDTFDEAAVGEMLVQPNQPFKLIRAATTGQVQYEPLQYNVQYMFHPAPDAFADALFAYAASIAAMDAPDAFLRNYDRAGPQRICAPAMELPVVGAPPVPLPLPEEPCADIQRIDGLKMESWIAENRAAHGLEFPGAGYTAFVLDSYTQGYLPQDTYHQYIVDDGTTSTSVRNYRAWGGAHDFVFLDVGAGPNPRDHRPWMEFTNDGVEYTDLVDGPIWDYADDMGTFYENLGRNLYDAVRILWDRSPIYPFEYAEKYVLPFYVFVDPNAHTNPGSPLAFLKSADVEANTDVEFIRAAFQELVPWAEIELTMEFVYLPDDDPGMAAALVDAKDRYSKEYVDFGIVTKYLKENWDQYVPEVPGARVYPTFAFWLDVPSQGLYAYSGGDEIGDSWAVIYNVADTALCVRPNLPLCFVEERGGDEDSWWRVWNWIFIHELGHSFGLTHAHDTLGLDNEGYVTYSINWLWDSTLSAMTYRHTLGVFDSFDKDLIFRANAAHLAKEVLAAPGAPGGARGAAEDSLDAIVEGEYADAFELARGARMAAGESLTSAAAPVLRGEPITIPLELPVGDAPLGSVPRSPLFVGLPMYAPGVNYVEFPIEIPEGATAMEFEYREVDAPTHKHWAAYVDVYNADGDWVTGLYANSYDKVVLLAIDRCTGGCLGYLYAYSGVGLSYEVTMTPWLG